MRWGLLFFALTCGCKVSQPANGFTPDFTKGPPAIVYKTKKDYSQNVPVILSEDRSVIVSYPGHSDVGDKEHFPVPVELAKGYLLDRRGINKNVAFLSYTYDEYASLSKIPSKDDLYKRIIDKDPLLELCDCGSQKAFGDMHLQLDQLIKGKRLRSVCRVVK